MGFSKGKSEFKKKIRIRDKKLVLFIKIVFLIDIIKILRKNFRLDFDLCF